MAGSKTGTTAGAAKLVRADIKAAAGNGALGSYPESVTFSVRTRSASMMSAIDVIIKGAPQDWALTADPRGIPGLYRVSDECRQLGRALKAIAGRHFEEDGKIYFADVQLDSGTCVA